MPDRDLSTHASVCECGAHAGDIHFDRSVCACGEMHYFCNQCGRQSERCLEPPERESSHAFDMDAAILEDAKVKLAYIRDEPVFELLLPSEADALLRALERAE